MLKLSERLKALRIDRGWTQTELANKTGISQRSVAAWEAGEYSPNGKFLEILADALDVTPTFLIGAEKAGVERLVEIAEKPYSAYLPEFQPVLDRLAGLSGIARKIAIEQIIGIITPLEQEWLVMASYNHPNDASPAVRDAARDSLDEAKARAQGDKPVAPANPDIGAKGIPAPAGKGIQYGSQKTDRRAEGVKAQK
jgi:transcriptional regulator with XRE-family HTH domain